MRISFLELGFLLIVAVFIITYSVYLLGKSSGVSHEIVLRRCGIALAASLIAAIGLMTHLLYYFPQIFEVESTPQSAAFNPEPTESQLTVSELAPTESRPEEIPVVDYAEILRNSEEYDGQEVRVAGRIAKLGFSSNKHSFYFRDRLGFLGIGKSFEVQLSQHFLHLSYDEEVGDYYVKNQYVLVQGVWSHSELYPALHNSEVIATGEEAQQADRVFMDEWEALGRSYSKLPLTDYMDLAEAPGHYLGQRIRTVGQIAVVGRNAVAGDRYISFYNRAPRIRSESFSMQGCPPEMQDLCVEGEYVILSCLVAENDWDAIEFLDCFVECVGEEAEAFSKQADAEWWGRFAAEREAYISACQQYTYDELARHPDAYKGKQIALNGAVLQVSESIYSSTIYLDVGQGHVVCVQYSGELFDDPKMLNGDLVTFYGVCDGRALYEPPSENSEWIPRIAAVYSDFNQPPL